MFYTTVSNADKSVEKQGDSRVFSTNLDVFWNRSQFWFTVSCESVFKEKIEMTIGLIYGPR